jgi:N-acetylneuraminate synthase
MKKVFIVAEAGGNHNGKINIAKKLIKSAKNCGADAIKFQTFVPRNLITQKNKVVSYQKKNLEKKMSPLQILKLCELKFSDHKTLKKYSKKMGLQFLSSAFDMESLNFLSKTLKIKIHKLPSGEITNYQLLFEHGLRNHRLIMSTGMSDLKEIKNAINVLAYGYLSSKRRKIKLPNKNILKKNYFKKAYPILKKKLTILHCTSNYPAKKEDLDLNVLKSFIKEFNLDVGYSDHSLSLITPIIAVSLGSKIIEKHFTLDNNLIGPDHKSSLEPKEFAQMVKNIRATEIILGSSIKRINDEEKKIKNNVRKVLVANQKIKKGEIFKFENLISKRSSKGISANRFWNFIGKRTNKSYKKDQEI